ncbi:uncharacterized protein LOC125474976 [Pyrus x bretschneideri]|uniref:uncharacterized protein LOC125474976 n=1 Tax=Pyrus x bretschneideri TaxID=225117 RepID=UPI002030D342|nr:uncharacterized protein LOC125474976 [Pyrus x bretschneideri]
MSDQNPTGVACPKTPNAKTFPLLTWLLPTELKLCSKLVMPAKIMVFLRLLTMGCQQKEWKKMIGVANEASPICCTVWALLGEARSITGMFSYSETLDKRCR